MSQENFIPYPFYWDDAPIDLSFLYEHEKPAGKHGFLKRDGDRFVFEDGTEARFWGVNFNSGACFPPPDKSEKIAKRLAKFGVNIVRLHQMDAHWANPNIFQVSKGRRLENTQSFDPESMKRLDYLIYCLKNEGIYIYMDLLTYRRFNDGDGVENTFEIADGAKSFSNFNRRMIELQKKYNYDLFTHYNPFTGLQYKDDPAICLSELTNEDDLFAREVKLEPYYGELLSKYRKWCEANNLTPEQDVQFRADFSRQVTEFMIETQKEYYREMIGHLREIGVKIPITGTNWSVGVHNRTAQLVTDFCDDHNYYLIWEWKEHSKRFKATHMLSEHDPFVGPLCFSRNFGYPMFISEWDVPWPNHYRAESPIYLAAVAAFQGWSGCAIHTYRYGTHTYNIDRIGKDLSAGAIGGVPYREGMFNTFNDPAKFGLFYAAALLLRRGDLKRGEKSIEIEFEDGDLQLSALSDTRRMPALRGLAEKHRVGVKLPGVKRSLADEVIDKNTILVPESAGEVTSDTGEMYRSREKGFGYIDSPRTKAAYGLLGGNGPVKLTGVEIGCENEFAVIVLSSLTDSPVCGSKNILLTTVGRAENKGMKFNDEGNELLDYGTAPIMVEVIKATISIQTPISNLKIWAVGAEGFLTGMIPAKYENGTFTFTTGETWPSIYYLIQAD